MTHPLVVQLRFARHEFERGLEGLSPADSLRRFEPVNSIGWMVGHLANQEARYWVMVAQGDRTFVDLNERVGYRKPASTPPLAEMLSIWRQITPRADVFLETLTPTRLLEHLEWNGKRLDESIGTLLIRNTYHYWYHLGEIAVLRQLMGHADLPEFVGDMSGYEYCPEL